MLKYYRTRNNTYINQDSCITIVSRLCKEVKVVSDSSLDFQRSYERERYRRCFFYSIGYGYDQAEAVKFREMLKERLEIEEIRIYQIGATIEVHMGMHAIGIIKYTE